MVPSVFRVFDTFLQERFYGIPMHYLQSRTGIQPRSVASFCLDFSCITVALMALSYSSAEGVGPFDRIVVLACALGYIPIISYVGELFAEEDHYEESLPSPKRYGNRQHDRFFMWVGAFTIPLGGFLLGRWTPIPLSTLFFLTVTIVLFISASYIRAYNEIPEE